MTLTPDQATRDIAIQHPKAVSVFESLGIDYCCGGAKTLGEACEKAHVDWEQLVELLQNAETPSAAAAIDWASQPLDTLSRHIVNEHHAYVRRATPELEERLEKVVARHGASHPELSRICEAFSALAEELAVHMMKEERVLFPLISRLAAGAAGGFPGSVEMPIGRMIAEHDGAGELLAKIRSLSDGYTPPAEACPTYRALYHGLAEFEKDLHQHIHLENNILFPGALKLERQTLNA